MPQTDTSFYFFLDLIGKGAFGKVYSGVQKISNRLVAIKCLEKIYFQSDQCREKVANEISIMQSLQSHPNVIQLLEVFENESTVFMVLEYASTGDLLKYIRGKQQLPLDTIRRILVQLVLALQHIHSRGVLHRDVKLDNILLNDQLDCKICDFGVSRFMTPQELIFEKCGTPAYLAPEVLQEKGYSGFKADIWSLGVLTFYLVTGQMPFKAQNVEELKQFILHNELDFSSDKMDSVSRDLFQKMLNKDPEQRIALGDILKHPFVSEYYGSYV